MQIRVQSIWDVQACGVQSTVSPPHPPLLTRPLEINSEPLYQTQRNTVHPPMVHWGLARGWMGMVSEPLYQTQHRPPTDGALGIGKGLDGYAVVAVVFLFFFLLRRRSWNCFSNN